MIFTVKLLPIRSLSRQVFFIPFLLKESQQFFFVFRGTHAYENVIQTKKKVGSCEPFFPSGVANL